MAGKKISGLHNDTVLIQQSNRTFEVTKDAVLRGGGEFNPTDPDALLSFGSGIIEDAAEHPGIHGNTYEINGTVKGLSSGIATFGEDTKIVVGKTGEVQANGGLFGGLGTGTLAGAVTSLGDNSKVIIERGGSVSGGIAGVVVLGDKSVVTNNGVISGSTIGMIGGALTLLSPPDPEAPVPELVGKTTLVNNGLLDGNMLGMMAAGENVKVTNGAKGEIISYLAGISVSGPFGEETEGGDVKIVNHGTISVLVDFDLGGGVGSPFGTVGAISAFGGDVNLKNDGKVFGSVFLAAEKATFNNAGGMVKGDVLFGEGNDKLDTIGGVIKGDIYGGAGNDTISVDNAKYALTELADEGNDTVKSTVTYKLAENVENLVLLGKKDIDGKGNAGDNTFHGNSGDNTFTGLGGIDTFFFGTKDGKDTITDFETLVDKIDVSDWNKIHDFNDILEAAKNTGDDVRIKVGDDSLLIENMHKTDLVVGDFAF